MSDLQSQAVPFVVGLALVAGVAFGSAAATVWVRDVGFPRLRAKFGWGPVGPLGRGSVHGLRPGRIYRVRRRLRDYYGNEYEAGEWLTFERHEYLPYAGGHTLVFAERVLYLQDEENADILGDLWEYLAPARR